MSDPTQRVTDRVADYVRYRPGYPPTLLDYLQQLCGLSPTDRIADVGSGTGQLTRLFLAGGYWVYGVEPNPAMRQAAESQLAACRRFYSQPGRAEATGLPDASVALVVAGQAFHWFDPDLSRAEFQRILSPGGCVALVWNNRDQTHPFQRAYESLLLQYAPAYSAVRHRRQDTLAQMQPFYGPSAPHTHTLDYCQSLDWAGLWGRLMSCSYAPRPEHPNHLPLKKALKDLFRGHQEQESINFIYQTRVYCGLLLSTR